MLYEIIHRMANLTRETPNQTMGKKVTKFAELPALEFNDITHYFRSIFVDELSIEHQNVEKILLTADTTNKKIALLRSWRKKYGNISQVCENIEEDLSVLDFSLSQYVNIVPFYEVVIKKYSWISTLEKQDSIHLLYRLIDSFFLNGTFLEDFLQQIPLLFRKYKALKSKLDEIDADLRLSDSEKRKLKALARYEEFSYGGRSVNRIARNNYAEVSKLFDRGILQNSELGQLLSSRLLNIEMYASHFSNQWGTEYIIETGELVCAAELQENPNIPFRKFTWLSDTALRNDSMCFFYLGSHDSLDYGSKNKSRNNTPFYLDIGNKPDLLNRALLRVHTTQINCHENILPTEIEQMSLDSELYPATKYREILIFQLYRKFAGNEHTALYTELIYRLKNDNDEALLRYIDANHDDLGVYLEIIVPSHVKLKDLIIGKSVK